MVKTNCNVIFALVLSFLTFQKNVTFAQEVPPISFAKATADFPGEEKNLRKWDAAVVADLDQDGWPDLILNDHGFGLRICWNNNGQFSRPYDLIMGDLHGVSVGDFDQDDSLEIVISRGGGSGSNARNSKIYRVDRQRNFTALPDFIVPLELMRGRTVKFFDGDNDGDLDLLNFAFPDKEKKGKSENYLYQNDGNAQLLLSSTLPPIKTDGQKTLLTDFNGDGVFDMLLYGHGALRAFSGNGDLTYEEVTEKIFPLSINEVTGIVEFDFDNDGDFDLYLTRGKGFEKDETFYDPETKTLGFYTKRGEFDFDGIKTGEVLQLENYHTQWPQINQLFIGETGYDYEYPGEKHSGKNIRLVNSNALGFPDHFSKDGIYIGYVGNQNWRIAGLVRSPLTAVIHGVPTYLESSHPKGLKDILLENINGKFADASDKCNLLLEEHTTAVAVADLNNDGFQDLIVLPRGDLIRENEALVFQNQEGTSFKLQKSHKIISPELGAIGLGVEVLDYNQDGKADVIIGNERGKWHLFKNTMEGAKESRFITVEVGNSPSGKATGLGALVEIEACGGKQIKRVGSTGAMYSQGFDHLVHFGLGKCSGPVVVKIRWTNGEAVDQRVEEINRIVPGTKD